MLRLILAVLLVAVVIDAITNNGAYTQRAWSEITGQINKLTGRSGADQGAAATSTVER